MVCQWYQHSKEVNQPDIHWQHGASIAGKTHQFLLEGGQTKGWNIPNCLVSISSSQWQGFPAVLIFNTRSSGEQLASTHTHTQGHVTDCITLITWSVAYSQILIWLLAPGPEPWKEVQQKWLQRGPLIGNIRRDFTAEFTMRNSGGTHF